MRKIVPIFLISFLILTAPAPKSCASIISSKSYRTEQSKIEKIDLKSIKHLFKTHNQLANTHNAEKLSELYSDNYINNDGFDKETYFKSIEETWKACENLTYETDIISININGDFASVEVFEKAVGAVTENFEYMKIAGEIHSKSKGIYYLEKINGKWYICGETSLSDESSLLYGDARFMNIEFIAPAQVQSGQTYTASVVVDSDDKTFIIGSIDHDPVTYPSKPPKSELRAFPQSSQTLERYIKANTDNTNEYAVTSLVISKIVENPAKVYMSGLACIMKRINVVPKNNFINSEE